MNEHQGKSIEISGNIYHYYSYGKGEKLMLAFHGFYQDATYFQKIYKNIAANHTIISIDLPHHGKSEFNEDFFEVKHIAALIDYFLKEYKQLSLSLFGYSLGGRVVINYIEHFPQNVNFAVLCAPDGFYIDKWYAMTTKSFVGKYLFKRFTQKPETLIGLIEQLGKYKLVSQRLLRFAKNNINDRKAFDQVAKVWPNMSKLEPNLTNLKKQIIHYKIPILLFVGKFDVVVRPLPAMKFAKEISNIKVFQLDTGHSFANEKTLATIAQNINQHL